MAAHNKIVLWITISPPTVYCYCSIVLILLLKSVSSKCLSDHLGASSSTMPIVDGTASSALDVSSLRLNLEIFKIETLILYLLVWSADNFCKQFDQRKFRPMAKL